MNRSRRVAVVVGERFSTIEFAIPVEVFGGSLEHLGVPSYEVAICSVTRRTVTADYGYTLTVPHGLEAVRRAGTVVVLPFGEEPTPELLDELRRAHRRGARIASVCTGAFTLAKAGLLSGRRATTHWMSADRLASEFPDVTVDPNVLYVDDGDILTSAGSAAGMDLCLHMVRDDHGAEVANALARELVVPPHRDGGQAQYVATPLPDVPASDPFATTLLWVRSHVSEPISVDDLARRAAMSPRTFARRFVEATGVTPHRFVTRERVRLAERLLETTDLSVEEIAAQCGFGTAVNLRQHFRAAIRCSPAAYRRTFRGARSAPPDELVSSTAAAFLKAAR